MAPKGLIILPEWFEGRFTDNYKILFYYLSEERGYDIWYTNHPKIPKDVEVVITHGIPHHNGPDYPIDEFLDFKGKLIGWVRDLQTYGNKAVADKFDLMFQRYDRILQFADETFNRMYGSKSEVIEKSYYFGQFVAPFERYGELPMRYYPRYNSSFLVSGNMNPAVYPLRASFKNCPEDLREKIMYLPGPAESEKAPIRLDYAKMLNRFMACMTDCSIYRMALAKHVEIAAAGSLLMTDECDDLKKMGFQPYEHYIPLTKENVWTQVATVAISSWNYDSVRMRARSHALSKHTSDNRLREMLEIIDDKR